MSRRTNPLWLLLHKGKPIFHVVRHGNPRDVLREFWFAVSERGAWCEAGNDAEAWADTFDIRHLPEEHRIARDMEAWHRALFDRYAHDVARRRWKEACHHSIRRALEAGYDLRQARDPRDLEPPAATSSADVDDDMPW